MEDFPEQRLTSHSNFKLSQLYKIEIILKYLIFHKDLTKYLSELFISYLTCTAAL